MVAVAQKTNVAARKRGPRCVPPETHNGVFRTHQSENRLIKTESLASVPDAAKVKVENLYDYIGRRVRKTVSSDYSGGSYTTTNVTTFIYDGWNLIAATETTDADTNVTYFVNGLDLSGSLQGAGGIGGLLAVIEDDGGTYFSAFDGNGNVTEYVDTNGTIVAHREYGPFGQTIAATGTKKGDFAHWFSTKYEDSETGLYYYGYRFYDPGLGRWPRRDPAGTVGGPNLYAYVRNRPTTRVDRLGLWEWPWEGCCEGKKYSMLKQCCCCDGKKAWYGWAGCKLLDKKKVYTGVTEWKWSGEPHQFGTPIHTWVTWPTAPGSTDSNGDSLFSWPIGSGGSEEVSTPAYATPTPAKPNNLMLSPCKHDFKKLWKCLKDTAIDMIGDDGGKCDAYSAWIMKKCKKESKGGCTMPGTIATIPPAPSSTP